MHCFPTHFHVCLVLACKLIILPAPGDFSPNNFLAYGLSLAMNFIHPSLVILMLLLKSLSAGFKYRHSSIHILQMLFPYDSVFRKYKVTEGTAIRTELGRGAAHSAPDSFPFQLRVEGHVPPLSEIQQHLGLTVPKPTNLSVTKSTS